MNISFKNILIIGNGTKSLALINKLKNDNEDLSFFMAPMSKDCYEDVTSVDIRENNPAELLKYALENSIDYTIVISTKALKSDIVSYFNANDMPVFAPTFSSCEFAINKAYCKKFLYSMKVRTPRFAIYEKEQLAIDYLKNAKFPTIISCEENDKGRDRFACPTYTIAKTFVEDLFFSGERKIVLEDFVYGHEFTFYTITDGYKVLPLTSVANYKFLKEGDGGLLTSGVGCYCHDYKISSEIENYLLEIISRILYNFQAENTPYLGILGVDCVLERNGKVSVLEFTPFFKEHDCDAVLSLVDENLLSIFSACTNGFFADEYEDIKISDKSAVSCTLFSTKDNSEIKGLEKVENSNCIHSDIVKNAEKYFSSKNQRLVLTSVAKTLSRAKNKLYEDIECIDYKGKFYRHDICS